MLSRRDCFFTLFPHKSEYVAFVVLRHIADIVQIDPDGIVRSARIYYRLQLFNSVSSSAEMEKSYSFTEIILVLRTYTP